MTPAQFGPVGQTVAIAGTLALFLPSLDKAWDSSPSDEGTRKRLRSGETLYLLTVFTFAALASSAVGSGLPLVIGGGLAVAVVAFYEHAFRVNA